MATTANTDQWPSLRVDDWTPTRETLHMWAQIVGKVRLAHMPMINHWWQVTLYVSPRGLTTAAIPHQTGMFDLEFDFIDHALVIRHSDGRRRSVALAAKPCRRSKVWMFQPTSTRVPTRSTRPFPSPTTISMPTTIPTQRGRSGCNSCRRNG